MNNLGIRLKQARKVAGLSLRALADLVDLSHAAIKKYEDGTVYPSSDILIKFAKALKVKIDFFFRPIQISLKEVKFRKRRKLSIKAEESIKFEVISQIERRLELENFYPDSPMPLFQLPSDLPEKILDLDEIECMAEKLREHWKLGLAPIHDLIDAFEGLGIRVFIVDTDEEHFDGLSTAINDQPIVVISSKWPGDRQRFNLSHELAHYVFIDRLAPKLNEEEACNRFAGAFLLPKQALFQIIGRKRRAIEWQELLLLKEQFQISIGAIFHRLKDLEIIDKSYHKKLVMNFRKKGWHRQEPGLGLPPEKSHMFNQMLFHALGEEYIGESKAAELLSCSLEELKARRQMQNSYASTH